jgi:hypothetical protein
LQTKGIECEVCHIIYELIVQYASDDEPTIQQYCDDACKKLGFLDSVCESLVAQYLPDLVNYVKQGKTEDEACSAVGLC